MENKKIILTSQNLEELKKHGEAGFPFQTYKECYETYSMGIMNLHWHRELEFNLVLSGTVLAQIDGVVYEVPTGDGIFVNSNVLHITKAKYPEEHTEHVSILFAPEFLSEKDSAIFREEIEPLLKNSSFPGFHLSANIPVQREILRHLSKIAYLHQHTASGYRLKILSELASVWSFLEDCSESEKISDSKTDKNILMQERTQKMLTYIHNHYAETITIEDIAHAAQISRSECFRCFQKLVRKKPVEYLNDYRLEKAAELLEATSLSVLEISICCGFNYQSYFGKQFQRRYQMSPLAYRNLKRENDKSL